MTWVRLDDGFTANAKVAQLSDAEFRVWVRVLCYCARTRDPTVDAAAVSEIKGLTNRRKIRFVSLELLDAIGDAYEVHDWELYQPKDLTNAERQARWRARRTVTLPVTEPVTRRLPPSRPVPYNDDDDTVVRSLRDAGWGSQQLTAAAEHPDRALAWLEHARTQQGVRNVAAFAWGGFSGGSWPQPVQTVPDEPNASALLSKTCPGCGETYGYGHLETCPRMPVTA